MSIYDDLADSGYLDKDEFRKHLQVNSHADHLKAQDFLASHKIPGYDYNTSDSGKVN